MRQIEIFEVPSPCIGVCTNGPRGYCTGCFRSRDERLHWLNIDNNTRKQINDACSRRKASYLKRKQSQANASQPTQVQESTPQQDSLF